MSAKTRTHFSQSARAFQVKSTHLRGAIVTPHVSVNLISHLRTRAITNSVYRKRSVRAEAGQNCGSRVCVCMLHVIQGHRVCHAENISPIITQRGICVNVLSSLSTATLPPSGATRHCANTDAVRPGYEIARSRFYCTRFCATSEFFLHLV